MTGRSSHWLPSDLRPRMPSGNNGQHHAAPNKHRDHTLLQRGFACGGVRATGNRVSEYFASQRQLPRRSGMLVRVPAPRGQNKLARAPLNVGDRIITWPPSFCAQKIPPSISLTVVCDRWNRRALNVSFHLAPGEQDTFHHVQSSSPTRDAMARIL